MRASARSCGTHKGDVDRASAVRARLIHPLEPQPRFPAARIDEVLGGTVAARLVPQRGAPERHHRGGRRRARNDEDALHRRRVGRQPQPSGGRRDPASHLDIAPAHPVVVVGVCDQAHSHPVVPKVNVGLVVLNAEELADRLHEPCACFERSRPEVRARTVADDPPTLDPLGFEELLRTDPSVMRVSLKPRQTKELATPTSATRSVYPEVAEG